MSCEHIIEGRTAAIIGYMLQVAAGLTAKQLCGQMLRGALRPGAVLQSDPMPVLIIEGVRYSAKPAMRCTNPHRGHPGNIAHRHQIVGRIKAQIGKKSRINGIGAPHRDRKSTRLNSSHVAISYAVFCLKKKKK